MISRSPGGSLGEVTPMEVGSDIGGSTHMGVTGNVPLLALLRHSISLGTTTRIVRAKWMIQKTMRALMMSAKEVVNGNARRVWL